MKACNLDDLEQKLEAYKKYLQDVRIQEAWDELCRDCGFGKPSVTDTFTIYYIAPGDENGDGVITVKKQSKDGSPANASLLVASGDGFNSQKKRSPSFLCLLSSNAVGSINDDIIELISDKNAADSFSDTINGVIAKQSVIKKMKRNLSRLRAANAYSAALTEFRESGGDNQQHRGKFEQQSRQFVDHLRKTDNSSLGQILLRAIISCLGFVYCAPASMAYGCSFWSRTRHDQIKTKVDLAVKRSSVWGACSA